MSGACESKRAHEIPGTGGMGCYMSLSGYFGPKMSLLHEQKVLLSMEPSLLFPVFSFLRSLYTLFLKWIDSIA